MDNVTLDEVLGDISRHLHLSKETETEVMSEIRTHLEDAVADARSQGADEQTALIKAAEQFGIEEVGPELQDVHANWDGVSAIVATALPVLFTLILRWLVFAPDGLTLDWPQPLIHPVFWIVSGAALVVPILFFRRWRFILFGWGFFWLLTMVLVIFPSINPK